VHCITLEQSGKIEMLLERSKNPIQVTVLSSGLTLTGLFRRAFHGCQVANVQLDESLIHSAEDGILKCSPEFYDEVTKVYL
jgi:hypothetical protein